MYYAGIHDGTDEYDLESELEKELAALGAISDEDIKAAQQDLTKPYPSLLGAFPDDETGGAGNEETQETASGDCHVSHAS
jgi:hypothetical protein